MLYSALIGFPTVNSLSNYIFKIFADSVGIEYAHLKIDIDPKLNNLKKCLYSLDELNFCGLNITIPYKFDVIELLDEVDPFAAKIGAVNTIYRNRGVFKGTNTDYIGLTKSILKSYGAIERNSRVVVFGTGGAAKACVGGLLQYTKNITVCYRDPVSLRTKDFISRFSKDVDIVSSNSEKLLNNLLNANVICNATPVGTKPDISQSILPIDTSILKDNPIRRLFFDAVYTPLNTKFLADALEQGFLIADGLNMMLYQGTEAFKFWTGYSINEDTIIYARKLVKAMLVG